MSTFHVRLVKIKRCGFQFTHHHVNFTVGTFPSGDSISKRINLNQKSPLKTIWSVIYKKGKHEQFCIGLMHKKHKYASLSIPFSWFKAGYVVREWFPMRTSTGWNGPMVLLDIHRTDKNIIPFSQPFSSLAVKPAWRKPNVALQQPLNTYNPPILQNQGYVNQTQQVCMQQTPYPLYYCNYQYIQCQPLNYPAMQINSVSNDQPVNVQVQPSAYQIHPMQTGSYPPSQTITHPDSPFA